MYTFSKRPIYRPTSIKSNVRNRPTSDLVRSHLHPITSSGPFPNTPELGLTNGTLPPFVYLTSKTDLYISYL